MGRSRADGMAGESAAIRSIVRQEVLHGNCARPDDRDSAGFEVS